MRSGVRRLIQLREDDSGAALVEFAIVVSLLIIIVFGAYDVGRYYTLRSRLTNAVREGARFGAVLTESAADQTSIRTYTKQRFVGVGFDTVGMTVTVMFPGTIGSTTDPRRIRVKATGVQFTGLSPIEQIASRAISDSAEFRREQP